jgi:large subunit ribosomal protein L17
LPKPTKGPRLGSGPSHERLMLAGLAADLIREERVRTTEAKAKRLRPMAERLITLGKNGSVHARRQALSVIEDRDVVHKLFAEVAPRFTERSGGYTRIYKLGFRKGDAAEMALIELVEGEGPTAAPAGETPARRRGLRRRRRKEPASPAEGQEPEEASETSAEASETSAEASETAAPSDESERTEAQLSAEEAAATSGDAAEAAEGSDVPPSQPGAAGEKTGER